MPFTNQEILHIAMQQSAIDANCKPEDFLCQQNMVVTSTAQAKARKYLSLPFVCNLISYGSNIVASTNDKYKEIVSRYINSQSIEQCFETPNIYSLNDSLQKDNLKVFYMAEYFLPDMNYFTALDCPYPTKVLTQQDFSTLYIPSWENALCWKRKENDILAVGAYNGNTLIGLAGASADCATMWQIGIDVLPAYRKQGIAAALTSQLAAEVFKHGKIPFYCASWANIKSTRNAIKCGFRPAWAELTLKPSTDNSGNTTL